MKKKKEKIENFSQNGNTKTNKNDLHWKWSLLINDSTGLNNNRDTIFVFVLHSYTQHWNSIFIGAIWISTLKKNRGALLNE